MKHETGICYNCGADIGLHQSETMQCPRHGIEETRFDKLYGRYYPQKWEQTVFEDKGKRILQDAAPDLLKALKNLEETSHAYINGTNNQLNLDKYLKAQSEAINIIKKAT